MAIAGHVDIGEAVVIVIADGDAEEKCAVGMNFAGGGDIGEGAVAVVAIKGGLRRVGGMEEWSEAAVDEEGVEVSVLVVVEPGDARAHRFGIHALGGLGAFVMGMNAGGVGDIEELNVVGIRVGGDF